MRALAVAAVVVYHLRDSWLPGGFLGVDVFFVLSGYLITGLLMDQHRRQGRLRLRAFWARRARRLLPELLAVLAVTATVSLLLGHDARVGLRGGVAAALGFYGNWWLVHQQTDYFARGGALPLFQHLWSLGIEEQFYLAWPLVLALMLKRRAVARMAALVTGLLAAASFALMATGSLLGATSDRLYYGSDTHSGGLLLGAAIALCFPLGSHIGSHVGNHIGNAARPPLGVGDRALTAVGVSALAFLCAAAAFLHGGTPTTYRGGIAAASVAAGALCLAAARPGPLARVLSVAPLRWLGRRSYAVYLWHWPIIACLSWCQFAHAGSAWVLCAEGAASVALAAASHRWLYEPVAAYGWRGAWSRLTALHDNSASRYPNFTGTCAGAVATVLVIAVFATVSAPSVTELQAQIQAGQAAIAAAAGPGGRADATDDHSADHGADSPAAGTAVNAAATGAAANAAERTHAGSAGNGSGFGSGAAAGRASSSGGAASSSDGTATSSSGADTSAAVSGGPLPGVPSGGEITAIGDSVMLASAAALEHVFPGIAVNAVVSRQMAAAPALLRALRQAGRLRRIVVVGLGTNGDFPQSTLAELASIAGPGRTLVFLTVHVPDPWQQPVNAQFAAFAAGRPHTVLVDWDSACSADPQALYPDRIHPNPAGAVLYADTLAAALR